MFRTIRIFLPIFLAGLTGFTILEAPFRSATTTQALTYISSSTVHRFPPIIGLPLFGVLETGCGGLAVQPVNAIFEQRLVELVNIQRQLAGVPPLKFTPALTEAARYHAKDMSADNYFNHDTYDRTGGSLKFVCAWNQRIQTFYTGGNYLGENIAGGADSPEDAMAMWMGSQGHRENILNANYWEFGGGFYVGGGVYGQYWVQDFGKRPGVYPLILAQEAAVTSSREVDLYIYGTWDEYRLRNDTDVWTAWMPFNPSPSWQLPASSGFHSVQVEMRTSTTSASAEDTIFLDLPVVDELIDLPDTLYFSYNIPNAYLLPQTAVLLPQNAAANPITWQVTGVTTIFSINPLTGAGGQTITISPVNFDLGTPGRYTEIINVEVIEPSGTLNSPQQVMLILEVTDLPIQWVHLPSLASP